MSNFNNFGQAQVQKTVVKFFLNISKKSSPKETILGYTHNGIIFASPTNDSSWIQFRAISDKQGATPMELVHQGQTHKIDPEKFWSTMFSCEVNELPDVKLKANIGDIDAGESLVEQGGCLVISVDVAGLKLSDGEYKGVPIVYFGLKVEEMYITEIKGTTVDVDWVMSSLSSAVTTQSCGKDALSRYRKAAPKVSPTSEMANKVKEEAAPTEDFNVDAFIDL